MTKAKQMKSNRSKLQGSMRNPQFRRKPRPKIAFDGTMLRGTFTVNANPLGSGTGRTLDYHGVNCDGAIGIARSHTVILDSYQQYRFRRVTMEWIPNVTPSEVNARATVVIATYTNPEEIFWLTQTATAATVTANNLATAKPFIFNSWERISFEIPMKMRKKWFDVNAAPASANIDQYDRDTQMFIGVGISGGDTSSLASLGQYRFTYELELRYLGNLVGT